MKCIYCQSSGLIREPFFSGLRTVTSDSKPWRRGFEIVVCTQCGFPQAHVTREWQKSAEEIYDGYTSYYQTSDYDQTIFIGGVSERRSELFVAAVLETCDTETGGAVLDFGCGSGNLLWSFSNLRSDLKLFGFDLDNRELNKLLTIPNFEKLIVGVLEKDLKFDLISMSHSLEHLTSPIETVKLLASLLNENGYLAIAVPDCPEDPFKLLIADHCSHFSVPTLKIFLEQVGFQVVRIESRSETRECWAICKPSKSDPDKAELLPETLWIGESIRWLNEVLNHAKSLTVAESFGLFGTSINALWLYGELELDIDFFVDEDVSRQHTKLFGRPVVSPEEVVEGSVVYLPFVPALATRIATRLSRVGVSWVVPPSSDLFSAD